jgi:folylpolyglutamate synthase/dihydropteroate synthase
MKAQPLGALNKNVSSGLLARPRLLRCGLIAAADLKKLIPKSFLGRTKIASVKDLFPTPQQCLVSGSTIVVIGSLYLAGEVLARYYGKKLNPHLQDKLKNRP